MLRRERLGIEIAVLIQLLREGGWKEWEIGATMGVASATIQRWRRGKPPGRPEYLEKLRALWDNPAANPRLKDKVVADEVTAGLRLLDERGWPRTLVGKRLGVTRQMLHGYENQLHKANWAVVERLRAIMAEAPPRTFGEALLDHMERKASRNGVYTGYARDVAKIMGIKSQSTIHSHWKQLAEKGLIIRLATEPGRALRWKINTRAEVIQGRRLSQRRVQL